MKTTELVDWLARRGAGKVCPFCDTNDWIGEIATEESDELVRVSLISFGKATDATETTPPTRPIKSHEGFLLTCANCGFVRLHNIKIVNPNG